jgi:D-cysteine desulfhydrase
VRALLARFPQLAARLAHVDLGVEESPLERWDVGGVSLLAKRDDLSAPLLGGNKVRALELLLAGAREGATLLTVGSTGSTHALAVAAYGVRLGLPTEIITWPQEMHEVAHATADRLRSIARVTSARSPMDAYARAAIRRLRGGRTWIPAGGSVPLGALGHVNAALELAEQLARGDVEGPHALVVPLGSGGTVAGLLAGLALAALPIRVVAVRVVPSVVGNQRRVLRLARGAHRLLEHLTGERLPSPDGERLDIVQDAYGGAYARETPASCEASALLAAIAGPRVEGTYSAKTLAVALRMARRVPHERILFWLTFDGRWLGDGDAYRP